MALKNTINLSSITTEELNTIKQVASSHQTMSKKFQQYSNQVKDPQFKQLFQQSSQDAEETATNLINSL